MFDRHLARNASVSAARGKLRAGWSTLPASFQLDLVATVHERVNQGGHGAGIKYFLQGGGVTTQQRIAD